MNEWSWFMAAAVILVLITYAMNSDWLNLKCAEARLDGKTYCVRDTSNLQDSVELLATVTNNMREMVAYMKRKHGKDKRVQRLVSNFNPDKVVETLPNSGHTAYSENKGSKLAFCLRQYKDTTELVDENTLTFVALHELAHLMTESVGHQPDFWENFKFLLKNAVDHGVYKAVDYRKTPEEYCGMTINDSPIF